MFYQQRLAESTGNHKLWWMVVHELLHSNDCVAALEPSKTGRFTAATAGSSHRSCVASRRLCQLPSKSSLLDSMPTSLFKLSTDVMAPLSATLANLSFSAGVFPTCYKVGYVVPLKKAVSSKEEPANYWLITNLCTFSRVADRLAVKLTVVCDVI